MLVHVSLAFWTIGPIFLKRLRISSALHEYQIDRSFGFNRKRIIFWISFTLPFFGLPNCRTKVMVCFKWRLIGGEADWIVISHSKLLCWARPRTTPLKFQLLGFSSIFQSKYGKSLISLLITPPNRAFLFKRENYFACINPLRSETLHVGFRRIWFLSCGTNPVNNIRSYSTLSLWRKLNEI